MPARLSGWIANGTVVPDGRYPFAVSLHTAAAATAANRLCSGSHISPEWIITAQHCFDSDLDGTIETGERNATQVWVSLNRTSISTTTRGEVLRGRTLVLNNTNDLALLRLERASTAPIIALATAAPATNTAITAASWGDIDAVGTNPNTMREGQFRVSSLTNALDLRYTPANNEEMCGGDSGGSVFTQAGGVFRLVAVHTNSPAGCGQNTGTATGSRVDAALAFIRANVPAAYGFAWAHSAAPALNTPYTASTSYAHNSAGGNVSVTRTGTGQYRVAFPGLGTDQPSGNVQVVSYGSANRCKVVSWLPSGTSLSVAVRCHTPAGALANTRFVVQYHRAGAGQANQGAYLWAHSASPSIGSGYTPSASYSYNSRGGTNRVTRTATGVYSVSLPGFTTVGGNVHVTAYGTDTRYCKVSSWGTSTVTVRCFSNTGAAADSRFTLQYTDRHVANNGRRGAYLWANNATSANYAPSATYRHHSGGAVNSAAIRSGRTGAGAYRVTLPNLPALNDTSVMVTGYGSASTYCTAGSWTASGSSTRANVRCYTASGAAVNALFTLAYLTNL